MTIAEDATELCLSEEFANKSQNFSSAIIPWSFLSVDLHLQLIQTVIRWWSKYSVDGHKNN